MITHIINKDKFTVGYINFMTSFLNEWQHNFILFEEINKTKINENCVVQRIDNWRRLNSNTLISQLKKSEKIIISGAFFVHELVGLWTQDIWDKVYIQLWGGDFYPFINIRGLQIRLRLKRYLFRRVVKKVNSIITLIDDDYEKFLDFYGIEKKHFTAVVPNDPKEKIDFMKIKKTENIYKNRILIGNSASPDNCHISILNTLSHLAEYDIEILCPLSYGNLDYREKVVSTGKKLFKNKFIPILNFMEKIEYIKLLNTCEIGIFNNNRQQALGNINIMLHLGKKVYLRTDTPMWNYYENWGEKVFDIETLKEESLQEILMFNNKFANLNYIIEENKITRYIEEWHEVLSDRGSL